MRRIHVPPRVIGATNPEECGALWTVTPGLMEAQKKDMSMGHCIIPNILHCVGFLFVGDEKHREQSWENRENCCGKQSNGKCSNNPQSVGMYFATAAEVKAKN